MAKLTNYTDLEHAVGHIQCLEQHFKRISDLLDERGVAQFNKKGQRFTVYERVCLALGTLPRAVPVESPQDILEAIKKEN